MSDIETVRRGPGRPPKYHEKIESQPVVQTETQAPARPQRKPFGSLELKMNYPARPGFHRHWFNDSKGRIERALEAGYTHVNGKDGKPVSMIVGTAEGGGPQTGFLMEIPEEWFQEDMAAQQRLVDEKEAMIKRGELEASDGDGRYVPKNADGSPRIKITRG